MVKCVALAHVYLQTVPKLVANALRVNFVSTRNVSKIHVKAYSAEKINSVEEVNAFTRVRLYDAERVRYAKQVFVKKHLVMEAVQKVQAASKVHACQTHAVSAQKDKSVKEVNVLKIFVKVFSVAPINTAKKAIATIKMVPDPDQVQEQNKIQEHQMEAL